MNLTLTGLDYVSKTRHMHCVDEVESDLSSRGRLVHGDVLKRPSMPGLDSVSDSAFELT